MVGVLMRRPNRRFRVRSKEHAIHQFVNNSRIELDVHRIKRSQNHEEVEQNQSAVEQSIDVELLALD